MPHARERNLPTGRADLVIALRQDHISRYADASDPTCQHLPGAVFQGPQERYVVRDTSQSSSVVGVHFRPGGAAALAGVTLAELANRTVPLDALWVVRHGSCASSCRRCRLQRSACAGWSNSCCIASPVGAGVGLSQLDRCADFFVSQHHRLHDRDLLFSPDEWLTAMSAAWISFRSAATRLDRMKGEMVAFVAARHGEQFAYLKRIGASIQGTLRLFENVGTYGDSLAVLASGPTTDVKGETLMLQRIWHVHGVLRMRV